MGDILSGRQQASNIISNDKELSINSDIAVVYDVILDETHPFIQKGLASLADIGSVQYRMNTDHSTNYTELTLAMPLDSNLKNLPVRNEQVQIYQTPLGVFYRRLEPAQTPNNSAAINRIVFRYESNKTNDSSDLTNKYKNTSSTHIANSSNKDFTKFNGFGKYFNHTDNIHKLKLYEGDYLLESRFGQSIRFSAYNNPKNIFSPTLIIRNSESEINRLKDYTTTIEEDINRDGSSLVMSSNLNELPFIPGIVNKNGISDFATKPESFKDYPTKLIGDQLLLNSGRIILSAKNAEMIFYSKKNYGFISDGALSIDNKLGIEASVGGDINVITNDRDVTFYTGNGNISLGDVDREPLVKGKQLKELLEDLIVAILNQTFLTPSGPSALGPENFNDFIQISDRINDILSKKNSTS